jgi:hypothetical protein
MKIALAISELEAPDELPTPGRVRQFIEHGAGVRRIERAIEHICEDGPFDIAFEGSKVLVVSHLEADQHPHIWSMTELDLDATAQVIAKSLRRCSLRPLKPTQDVPFIATGNTNTGSPILSFVP